MIKRIHVLLVKELAQIRRDKKLFGILIMAPLIQLIVLGYAATTDVKDVSVAIRDHDHSWHSREYARALASSGYLKTLGVEGPSGQDIDLLISGRAGLVVDIPEDFGKPLSQQRPATVQVVVDGADSNFAVQGLQYLMKATRLFSQRLRTQATAAPEVAVESRIWYNPDLRSTLYMVPAIMGVLLLVTTMLVTSMALVKEREDGTMEQLIVTPLRPLELMAGKLLPFVVIGFVEVTLILPIMMVLFDVPLKGSLLAFYGLSGLFLLNTLALGLLISTLVKTQQQAMMFAAFFVMMPYTLLSGFIFPVENMPGAIRWTAYFIPLKYYLTMVRGIFLKGIGPAELWPQGLALLILGSLTFIAAIRNFHKRLD